MNVFKLKIIISYNTQSCLDFLILFILSIIWWRYVINKNYLKEIFFTPRDVTSYRDRNFNFFFYLSSLELKLTILCIIEDVIFSQLQYMNWETIEKFSKCYITCDDKISRFCVCAGFRATQLCTAHTSRGHSISSKVINSALT